MSGQTDRHTDKQTDRQTYRRTDGRTGGQTDTTEALNPSRPFKNTLLLTLIYFLLYFSGGGTIDTTRQSWG